MIACQDITKNREAVHADLVLEALVSGLKDPRVKLALGYCKGMIGEPPLSLAQIQAAIGVFRPKGRPCFRTIQRWAAEKKMPWCLDTSSNQRVYFLSRVLSWYQKTFAWTDVVEETAEQSRHHLLSTVIRKSRVHAKAG
jgi:hypothetical protein